MKLIRHDLKQTVLSLQFPLRLGTPNNETQLVSLLHILFTVSVNYLFLICLQNWNNVCKKLISTLVLTERFAIMKLATSAEVTKH